MTTVSMPLAATLMVVATTESTKGLALGRLSLEFEAAMLPAWLMSWVSMLESPYHLVA